MKITLLATLGWVSWLAGCALLAYFEELHLMWPFLLMIIAVKFFEADNN